jgi:hypothetical protein
MVSLYQMECGVARHYGEGSRMAAAFLVRCSLFSIGSLSTRGHTRGFGDYLRVGFLVGAALRLLVLLPWSSEVCGRVEVPIQPIGFGGFELSLPTLMSQSN